MFMTPWCVTYERVTLKLITKHVHDDDVKEEEGGGSGDDDDDDDDDDEKQKKKKKNITRHARTFS